MRLAILILACCITLDTYGQFRGSKDLFQVILADKVARSGGKSIKSMDFLQKGDTLVVSSGGTLAMLHRKIYPVEISKDSVVVISSLSAAIESHMELNRQIYSYTHGFKELDVSWLFALFPKDIKSRKFVQGAVHAEPTTYRLFYPPTTQLNISEDVCVEWRQFKDESYTVEILDFYENLLASFAASANSLKIAREDILKITKEPGAILRVLTKNGERRSHDIIMMKAKDSFPFAYSCDLDKPSVALLVALGLEFDRWPSLDGAEKYYVLATTLSSHPFYTQMLSNYRERRKANWDR